MADSQTTLAKVDKLRALGRAVRISDHPHAMFWARECFLAADYLIDDPDCRTYQWNAENVLGHMASEAA